MYKREEPSVRSSLTTLSLGFRRSGTKRALALLVLLLSADVSTHVKEDRTDGSTISMHIRETIVDNSSLTPLSFGCRRRYETRTRRTRAC